MCDELWMYHHDSTTKQESSGYHQKGDNISLKKKKKKKFHQNKLVGKVLLVAIYNLKGKVYQH